MTIQTRPIAAADWPVWCALWRDYLAFYGTVLPPERFRLQFARLTDPAQTAVTGCLAENGDGRVLGLAHCIWHVHGWHEEPVCYLQDLYTVPDARSRGVGRALIQRVYGDADARHAANVYWTTQTFNQTARALYDRVGRATDFIKYERAG